LGESSALLSIQVLIQNPSNGTAPPTYTTTTPHSKTGINLTPADSKENKGEDATSHMEHSQLSTTAKPKGPSSMLQAEAKAAIQLTGRLQQR
ncbi:MAG: hypothetical protein DRN99_03785, partial [Thermoproteota archaeon]